MIVMKYANHDAGVSKFFKFHSFVVSSGYLEKKYNGWYVIAGGQRATLLLPYVQARKGNVKSASSLSI